MNSVGSLRRFAEGAALAAIALLAACARGADSTSDVVRADSSGVLIMTSGARDTALSWTFDEIDVFRDSLGDPYLFTNLSKYHVLTDRNGRTYVLTRDPSIVRFGRDGKQELTVGRKGGGPGEFEFPMAIGAKSDTVWVMDGAKGGLVRFLPDLSPTADQRLEGALAGAQMISFRTGGVWFQRTDFTDSAMVASVYADTLGSAPLQSVTAPPGGPVNFGCVGLSASAPIFAPQVSMHASVARLLVNAQPGYELWLYEGSRAIGSIRRPLQPRAPTAEDVRMLMPDGMRVSFGGSPPDCVVPVEEVMEKQGVAPLVPFVFDVVLLSDGSMWALRTPHQAPPVVDVFGPDGVYAGTMRGRGLPLALLPNGEMLFAKDDEESGGKVIVRVRVVR
jgi:hypothetical protein